MEFGMLYLHKKMNLITLIGSETIFEIVSIFLSMAEVEDRSDWAH